MIARVAAVIYGLIAYLIFTASFVYMIGFVGNLVVPKSIDLGGSDSGLAQSIAINAVLLGLFAVPHSAMARPGFKRWWAKIVPPSCERSTYVLVSSLLLVLVFWQWRPITTTVWRVEGAPAMALTALFWLGWLIGLVSTHLIDHFELFGVRQVLDALKGATARVPLFKTPLLYRLVRHPLMTGLLLAFWATPHMTVGHLLFAGLMTAYILVGVWFEERDLVAQFGATYEQYRRRVPKLMPRLFGGRGA